MLPPQLAKRGVSFAYDRNGRVTRSNNAGITECNEFCPCPSTCPNKVVGRGRTVKLQIFMTTNRGWGLCTLEPIQKGTYIDSYLGLVITREEAERRGTHFEQSGLSYLFDLDFYEANDHGEDHDQPKDPDYQDIPKSPGDQDYLKKPKPKKKRPSSFAATTRRRTKRVKKNSPVQNGSGKALKGEQEVYEEVKDFQVKDEIVPFGAEEVGESSMAATCNHSVDQESEDPSGPDLDRSASKFEPTDFVKRYTLDSREMGNVTRFSNHSCDPNLDIYSVITNGSQEIFTLALFANRFIEAGSELTFSYCGNNGLERAQERNKNKKIIPGDRTDMFRCRCGTKNCIGYYWN
ncbi:SET domain-containing protein [Choiromyces venosus 120613-1]|uniref:SET domain-containing protein n=1 Tax=Choiromyces venosus 120613-1 TaxID=1336337 RepID=A0A3N4JUX2_9PEZI|nr:SET domain-containing protein [Choiromyces venosus 120613-1]